MLSYPLHQKSVAASKKKYVLLNNLEEGKIDFNQFCSQGFIVRVDDYLIEAAYTIISG